MGCKACGGGGGARGLSRMPEAPVTAGRQETPSNTSQASSFGPAADTLAFS